MIKQHLTAAACAAAVGLMLSAAMPGHARAAISIAISNFRGDWDPTVSYGAGAVVTYAGQSYIAIVKNINVVPTETDAWATLDAPGPQGVQGPAGSVGTPGPAGATGASGAVGPAGPVAFTSEADKFRNYASAWRDRWNSVMELFMAGGNYAVAAVQFPNEFPAAVEAEMAAAKNVGE